MGWFKMFRLWQPHADEYLFVWNWVVAKHTLEQLSPSMIEKVKNHYQRTLALNNPDPGSDIGFLAETDYFWLSMTLADMGIAPMLGPKGAKWFYIQNHRRARWCAGEQGESLATKVLKDILTE
jgi:hypothetical protein